MAEAGRWSRKIAMAALVFATGAMAAPAAKRVRHVPVDVPAAVDFGRVTDVRFWFLADATRVAIEVSDDFEFHSDRLENPSRIFFDIVGVKPAKRPKGVEIIPVSGPLVKQIRVAETQPGTTRVVLDLSAAAEFESSKLSNPNRLMIEVRPADRTHLNPIATAAGVTPPVQRLSPLERRFEPPVRVEPPPITMARLRIPKVDLPALPSSEVVDRAARSALDRPMAPAPASDLPVRTKSNRALVERSDDPAPALAARRNASGDQSLTRVLGLKLGRVVLDPGHGGHDSGTHGPTGLQEKDLVLDVAKRLGALIEARLGSEVVYTRTDDTFIPLEERTRIANRHKADLFLSIHANSSPARSASGIETYYLNFTTSKASLDLAARENAASERSIYDLRDLVQKIALKDKLDESREFAARVQESLSSLSARTNRASKDRGVKKAPFVVLIGASMPSILAEIGFVSNSHDEALMKKPEYRQRIAEALYKGIAQYAATLSHFQVARKDTE